MSKLRAVAGSLVAAGAVVVAAGATAFACVTPAVINLSTAEGRPGQVVTVTGKAFSAPPGSSGVEVRWAAPNGVLLAQAMPDGDGTFTTTFTVPDGPPGFYSVVAVLRDADGADVAGTPGRAMFELRTVAAAPTAEPDLQAFTPVAEPVGSSFPVALVAGLGVVGLVLFAGGFVAVTRTRRTSRPVPAPVRRD
ncbi:MAG: hypothetical protein AB1673_15235 [Actinomycetota bacterium]